MSTSTVRPTATAHGCDRLLTAGIAGPCLFLAAVLLGVAGGRTSGSAAASGMEIGSHGWLMSIVFVITGGCIVAFAAGQSRALSPASRVGTVLLGIAGAAVLASGFLIPDPKGAPETAHGQVHNLLFLVTMLCLVVSFVPNGVKLRRAGLRGALAHSVASTVAVPLLVGVFVTSASDPGDPLYSIGGIVELALIAVGFGWIAVNSARLRRAADVSR